jgi:hydrogenase maturation protease
MNRSLVDRIADAVLYEGYILYPYRPSVKNRSRWTFGSLYPEAYCQAYGSGDASSNQTECLVRGTLATVFDARVRFLHLTARSVGEVDPPLAEWPDSGLPPFRPVETLQVGDQRFHQWQEAEEREVVLGAATLGELSTGARSRTFASPVGRRWELLRGAAREVVGVLVRRQQALEGLIEVAAAEVEAGLFRLRIRVVNRTPWERIEGQSRDLAALRCLASTHAILTVRDGAFVSLLDPPECWRGAAAACHNLGIWPVLVGEEGQHDTMLAAPIILYDYPQVAPESPGDFFDGTEIDEMLSLRIMTLTDQEKDAMAAVDERARALLARTEGLAPEQMLGLHGTIRGLRIPPQEEPDEELGSRG